MPVQHSLSRPVAAGGGSGRRQGGGAVLSMQKLTALEQEEAAQAGTGRGVGQHGLRGKAPSGREGFDLHGIQPLCGGFPVT